MSRTTLQPVLDELRPIYLKLMNEFVYSNANNICSSSKSNVVSNYSICRAIAVHLVDKYYPLVTNAFANAANRTVPRGKSDALKHWWSNDLQNDKIKSIESHRLWVDAGRPRSGPVFDLYKNHKFAYKLAIRNAKCNAELSITNDLHDALCSKDTNSFWKIWNSKLSSNKLNKPRIVDGLVDGQAIADRFADVFYDICKPNTAALDDSSRERFNNIFLDYAGDRLNKNSFFSVELICKVICELKSGKASGADDITSEHIVHCHQAGHLLITYMCNLMLLAGHVPPQFGIGVTFPIPKANFNIKSATFDDFRGITISPVISKILEKCIIENFEMCLKSSDKQFGFKKKIGCGHTIFCLRSIVDIFSENGSTVNICSLDVSKAFDKVNHSILFIKLMQKRIPVNIIKLLVTWYANSVSVVNWYGIISKSYTLRAGVRQGGVLSPNFFSIYVDGVISAIDGSNLGCKIGTQNMGILMYADDLVLISASVCKLQTMISICVDALHNLDLKVNFKKSTCMRIGTQFKCVC